MFQRRLVTFSVLVFLAILILVARLVQLQLVDGPLYSAKAEKLLDRRPRWLDTLRGSIYDRNGKILAQDQPGFRICLHYKLTRLYDSDYWLYRKLIFMGLKVNRDKTEAEAIEAIKKELTPQLERAEALIKRLSTICRVSEKTIRDELQAINHDIRILQTSRARRLWYDNNNVTYKPMPNYSAIVNDFEQVVPEDSARLKQIYQAEVVEMTEPQPILNYITPDEALAIEETFLDETISPKDKDRPVTIRTFKVRKYPFDSAACHLIGQMGPVPSDLLRSRPVSSKPKETALKSYYMGDRYGHWGLEYMFESYLRGTRGWVKKDNKQNVLDKIELTRGNDLTTTIDIELQQRIYGVLMGNNSLKTSYRGGAVVIDVATGEVLAMVSVPTFGLNDYWQEKNFNEVMKPRVYWPDRAMGKNYQTGSTIKPTMLLGELTHGIVTSRTSYDCSWANKTWSGKPDKLHNHGPTDARKAVQVSCNYYFIMAGLKLGAQGTVDWLKNAGFGRTILSWPEDQFAQRAGIAFRETSGFLSPIGRDLPTTFHLRFMAIGLNPLNASVLQIANSMATIARGGVFVGPKLVKSPDYNSPAIRIASQSHANIVEGGMEDVIYTSQGTGITAFTPLPWPKKTVTLYGKTGSSGECSIFSCYAKAANGRTIAVAVVAEEPRDGSIIGAPLAKDILIACSQEGYLPEVDEVEP